MRTGDGSGRAAAEASARQSYGRLVAFLAARTRDLAGAEDALADAFAAALTIWPKSGVPDNPDAWLMTVARRRQTDALRRSKTRVAAKGHLQLMADEIEAAKTSDGDIPDRRLGLMFACAHPAMEPGMRAPLILQSVLGMNAKEIAAAFLISPTTMGQRLVRAKARIRNAGIPFKIPDRPELAERLDAVLDAIYAAYTKGWTEIGDMGQSEIAGEAIWLGQLIVTLLPEEPEAKGMLALMLYTEARRAARRDASGAYVALDKQDRDLWDREQIDLAENLLAEANKSGPSGRYQLEAAIQSAHGARLIYGVRNWPEIVALYDHLLARTGSPVVALNRAVALSEVEGAEAGLLALQEVVGERLETYQPYWAAKAHLCAEAGRVDEAADAFERAIALSSDAAARDYLASQLARLGSRSRPLPVGRV